MTRPIVKLPEAFRETTVGEEVAVMRLSDGDFFSLTGTARTIWELIDGRRDAAAIVAELGQRYAADAAMLEAEVERFVGELRQAGLLAHA
jgi:pyrroloquinoline quinone biosynthesis protein D